MEIKGAQYSLIHEALVAMGFFPAGVQDETLKTSLFFISCHFLVFLGEALGLFPKGNNINTGQVKCCYQRRFQARFDLTDNRISS